MKIDVKLLHVHYKYFDENGDCQNGEIDIKKPGRLGKRALMNIIYKETGRMSYVLGYTEKRLKWKFNSRPGAAAPGFLIKR